MTLPRLRQVLDEHQATGEHTGVLLSLSIDSQVVEWCDGEMRPGQAMAPDTRIAWLSAGKPLTAVALACLWQGGQLDLDDPVKNWVPAFAERGKESVTLRHVLTHTGGFASMFDLDGEADSWQDAVRRVCSSRGRWEPGQRAAYQARSGWQILGEVVRSASGVELHEYVAANVLEPAGMHDSWLWLQGPDGRVAPVVETTSAAAAVTAGHSSYCSPGAGAGGTMADLRRFYEMLLHGGQGASGRQVLQPQTVATMTARHRTGMLDESFRHIVDWGLGFVLDSNRYGADTVPYGYGQHCSERTFGHGGSQCCTGFADPEYGLVVALAVNGRPGEAAHGVRFRRALTALYEDLGLSART